MSATLVPPAGVPALARTDPDARRRDYEQALGFYVSLLGRPLDGIVFVDNSGADLSSLRAVAGDDADGRVEFLSFDGLDHPPACGRGYGEFKLVDHAMAHSELIGLDAAPSIWKVTGRYLVRNLPKLVACAPARFDLYCNLRDRPLRWADMYLLSWSREGYGALIDGVYREFDERMLDTPPEVRFRELVDDARLAGDLRIVPRFSVTPRIEGVRGGDERSYRERSDAVKDVARTVARRLAPSLWI